VNAIAGAAMAIKHVILPFLTIKKSIAKQLPPVSERLAIE